MNRIGASSIPSHFPPKMLRASTILLAIAILFVTACRHEPPKPTTTGGHGTSSGKKKAKAKAKRPSAVGAEGPSAVPNFPWPPPAASATQVLPRELMEKDQAPHTLADINAKLAFALDNNGYAEKSYYAVPDGFALVTRLEQTDANGKPKIGSSRWSIANAAAGSFRLSDYLRALFTADTGYYRVIVFIVSDVPFAESDKKVSSEEATGWLKSGLNVLPAGIGDQPYSPKYVTTVLIYEFDKDQGKAPQINQPGRLGAHDHLVNSGLWGALGGAL